ncbi:MAG: phasin family protein [Gammaproteobacteria bacterium]|nr:phasin family protein [Gammaproteobacteria bacterium]NND61072.1 hypothetical protein [Gammaproteobacteria bacterium]
MTKRNSAEEKLAQFLSDSAQQVWSAGLGALHVAEKEGSKIFETLSKLGETLETNTRRTAETAASQTTRASKETIDKLEAMFEARVARVMASMDIPDAKTVEALQGQVDGLAARVIELQEQLDATRRQLKAMKKKKSKKKAKKKTKGKK